MITQRYEHIRAMRQMHQQHSQEMSLIIASGMNAWMEAWRSYGDAGGHSEQAVQSCCDGAAQRISPAAITPTMHDEAVSVLTAMVFDIVKEDEHAYHG